MIERASTRRLVRLGSRQTRNATDDRIGQNGMTIHREVVAPSLWTFQDL